MVIDKIQNIQRYKCMHDSFGIAVQYLLNNDFTKVETGTYQIEGNSVFSMVQAYATRVAEQCNLESHRRYIDIQYIVSGCEQIGISTFNNQESIEGYDSEKDLIFYDGSSSPVKIVSRGFCDFFPGRFA